MAFTAVETLQKLDTRYYQTAALACLLLINMAWIDFGATPLNSAVAIGSCLVTQAICTRLWGVAHFDPRSALITGLSLSLLLRADDPMLFLAAGAIAMLSKFTLRIDGKHLWNPACFAIVVLHFATPHVWISPGQWGSTLWLALLLALFAIMVLQQARRSDTALFFLGAHAALLAARAYWLGDPWTIPLHQLESGSVLLFTFFMVTDPRTTPDDRWARFGFAVLVAVAGHYLAFFMQLREALYVALFAAAPLVPLLDRVRPARRFTWTVSSQHQIGRGA